MDKTKVTKDLENKTLVIERVFDASVQRVWDAYSKPELFVKWWGPEGWETTVKEFDFKVGGRNHYCMTCTDKDQGEWFGQESWGLMVFESIEGPNSFTYKDYFSDKDGVINQEMPGMTVAMEFHDEDGKTRIVSRGVVETAAQIEELINMGMIEGLSSTLDRLEELLK